MQNEWGITPLDGVDGGVGGNHWGITILDLVGPQGATGEAGGSGLQGATGAQGATGPQGLQGTPATPVALTGFSASQIGSLAVTNPATLYRLEMFPIAPGGADYDNGAPDIDYPDAFTFRILTPGEYTVSGGVNFTWGAAPSDPQTVELAITDSALTFAYASNQREIVVGSRQNEAFCITRTLSLIAGDQLALSVQSITGGPLPGADAFDGWLSVTRVQAASSPAAWEIGGNASLAAGDHILGTQSTILSLNEGDASFTVGGTSTAAPTLVVDGSFALNQRLDAASGNTTIPGFSTSSYVKSTNAFSTLTLPACGATGDAPRLLFVTASNTGTTAIAGLNVATPGSDRILAQGTKSTTLALRGRMSALLCELPGQESWGAIASTPAPYFRDFYIPATPDPAVVTDWWVAATSTGWSVEPKDGSFPSPLGTQFSLTGGSQLRITNVKFSLDSAAPGAGSGWTVGLYTANPFSAPSLITQSNYTGSGSGLSFTVGNNLSMVTPGGAYYIRVTIIGSGIPTKRAFFSIGGYLPGAPS